MKIHFKIILAIIFLFTSHSCSKTTEISATPNAVVDKPTTPITTNPIVVDKFETGDGFTSSVLASEIDADGKLICAGIFRSFNNKNVNFLVRLNKDGSLDSTFIAPKEINSWIRDIILQADGKLIVGGDNSILFRLNKDGSIDNSFNTGKGFSFSGLGYDNSYVSSGNSYLKGADIMQLIANKDGSFFALGSFDNYNSKMVTYGIIKLKSDGIIDETFTPNMIINGISSYKSTSLLPNGNLLISNMGLQDYTYRFPIAITQNGIIDTLTYKSIGEKSNHSNNYPSIITSAVQNDGKIIFGGGFTNIKGVSVNNIVRIQVNGSIDESFNIGSGFNDVVQKIQLQSDGKILVAGQFTKYNNSNQNHLVRLNTDGSIDNTFNSGLGFTNLQNTGLGDVSNFNFRSDGKIFITGGFSYYNGTKQHFVVRINPDGSL